MAEQDSQKPHGWYENRLMVILWLILFPPVGLYGMWKSSRFSQTARYVLTTWVVVLVLGGMIQKEKHSSRSPQQTIPSSTKNAVSASSQASDRGVEQAPITWREIDNIYNLKHDSTEIQKAEAWKRYKGKKVIWSGVVVEVSDGFAGLTLQVRMNSDTFTSDVLIRLKRSERDKALQLRQGREVKFSGYLDDWGTLMPITLDDGEIL